MNKTFLLSVVTTMGISVGFAQDNAAPPAAAPPPAPVTNTNTNATATNAASPAAPHTNKTSTVKKSGKSSPTKTAAAQEPIGPPVIVGPAVVKQNNINVRSKAAINSEVLTHLKKGDHIEVLEIVTRPQKPNEPDKWARVPLPTNSMVWVHSDYVDATNKTTTKRLNLRSGPSENHTVIGRLEKGAAIKELERKGDWIHIEPPQSAYAFIAAHLLAPATPPTEIAKTQTPPATNATALAETKVETTTPAVPPTDLAAAPGATTTTITNALRVPVPETQEDIKRVVSREGIVKRSVSIQAPTWFVLESPQTGRTINYLYTPTTNVALRGFFGQRVIVTGEEGLDERWPHTPVINVDSIEVVP